MIIAVTVAIPPCYRLMFASWLIILSPLGHGLAKLRTSGLGEGSYKLTTPTWSCMWHSCTTLTMISLLVPTLTCWISLRKQLMPHSRKFLRDSIFMGRQSLTFHGFNFRRRGHSRPLCTVQSSLFCAFIF